MEIGYICVVFCIFYLNCSYFGVKIDEEIESDDNWGGEERIGESDVIFDEQ